MLVAKITQYSSPGFLRVQGRVFLAPETQHHNFCPLLSHSAATRTRPVVLAIVPCVVFTMITGVQDGRVLRQDTPPYFTPQKNWFEKKYYAFLATAFFLFPTCIIYNFLGSKNTLFTLDLRATGFPSFFLGKTVTNTLPSE